MNPEAPSPNYEIASVLFMDIVSYSLLSMEEQRELLTTLQSIVRGSVEYNQACAKQELISLPTGDGMALVFMRDPVSPVKCALEIAASLKSHPELRLRMGINQGPVFRHADIKEQANVVGGGINMAQRVMDCGDAGHILVSRNVAELLAQLRGWSDCLQDLGIHEVKHGVKVQLYNLCKDGLGNQVWPARVTAASKAIHAPAQPAGFTPQLRELTAVTSPGAGEIPSAPAPFSSAIPAARTALIGREDEIARLRELIADAHVRVLTLAGAGGVGKTRLALELVRQSAGDFPGGVGVVLLEKIAQAGLVPSEVMRALGVSQSPEQDPAGAIADHFQRNNRATVLLLLDNFEHVMAAADFVASLPQDRLKIVITSRAPLRIYGEYEFPVPPLLSPQPSGDGAALMPAVRLFLDRAPGLRGAALDREQLQAVSEICQRLDGLPLAIEMAAARTKVLPLKSLLQQINEPLAVLVGGARDLPQRQRTLRATLDWSYNLLDGEHQKLFRRLAVFVGGATIDAIESVCDTRQDLQVNLWEALEQLVDNSLVRRVSADHEEPRFATLQTMREYGLERLAEAGEGAYTRKAHAAYCLVLAEEQNPTTRRERTGDHRFDAELGNFRAALDWLIGANEAEWGLRLMLALSLYFFSLRLHREGAEYIKRLLRLPGVDRFPRLRNWGMYNYADFAHDAFLENDPGDYLRTLKAVLQEFEDDGDAAGMFIIAHRLGYNFRFIDLAEARKWSERAVEMARSGFPPLVLAGALSNLADVVQMAGEFSLARSLHLETAHLFEQGGDRENAIWTLSHQADLYREQGQDEDARSMYLDALGKFRAMGNTHGIASCLHDLGRLQAADGNLEEARAKFRECLKLYGPKNLSDLPRVLEALAAVTVQCGEARRAVTLAGAAASMRERFDLKRRYVLGTGACENAAIDAQIENARLEAGAEAAALWMKGWNMSPEEIVDWAAEGSKGKPEKE
jgi:predicted ATPase/class 3 adenylate cyclase